MNIINSSNSTQTARGNIRPLPNPSILCVLLFVNRVYWLREDAKKPIVIDFTTCLPLIHSIIKK